MCYFCFLLKFIQNYQILEPRNAREKKFWTHDMPTRKKLRPTKHPREKYLDPQKHDTRWHETHETNDGTRPTEFSTLSFINE